MNQPPTIPEGDEENEGVEQIGEGTRFPHTGAQQHAPHAAIHDTVATASDLQPREDEGLGYGQTPTVQPELVAVSGDVPTDAPQQAQYDQPSSVEHRIIEDGAKEGEPPATDAENELLQPLPEGETLEGITEEGSILREPVAEQEEEKPVPVIDETLDTTPQVVAVEEPEKPDESVADTMLSDDHRRSARSGRDRSTKGIREPPQVDFEEGEQEEQEVVHEEPEIRISREELIARYQAAEVERDRLKGINIALQQRLADYLHKRKGTDDLPALHQGTERSNVEQQQRYQKCLSEIEILQESIKHDQIEYEKQRNEYEQHIDTRKENVERLKNEYVRLVKDVASKAVFSRSGKAISNQEVENYLTLLREKEEELIRTRHENTRLKNQLKKRELQLKSKEELAEGLHMIDFEQLKIENQTYSEKIEERNEELMKLRKKIGTTVQILSHIKEKLSHVSDQREQAAKHLNEREEEVKQKRDELSTIKRRRDRLRQENQSLKQNSGLIGNEQLLRDYEERYDDIEKCTEKLDQLKKRHAEITLMCKVLKKKISKV